MSSIVSILLSIHLNLLSIIDYPPSFHSLHSLSIDYTIHVVIPITTLTNSTVHSVILTVALIDSTPHRYSILSSPFQYIPYHSPPSIVSIDHSSIHSFSTATSIHLLLLNSFQSIHSIHSLIPPLIAYIPLSIVSTHQSTLSLCIVFHSSFQI